MQATPKKGKVNDSSKKCFCNKKKKIWQNYHKHYCILRWQTREILQMSYGEGAQRHCGHFTSLISKLRSPEVDLSAGSWLTRVFYRQMTHSSRKQISFHTPFYFFQAYPLQQGSPITEKECKDIAVKLPPRIS